MSSQSQPPQPPKQSTYTQPQNPISQTSLEQEQRIPQTRHRGDPISPITRGPNSNPANNSALSDHAGKYKQERYNLRSAGDVDTEYGVEQEPAEGDIAAAVEGKSARVRAQAGAHAGPVGSAMGPGGPGELDLDRKREEHEQILGERVGKSPAEPGWGFDGESEENEEVRRRLERERRVDVGEAVREGTGGPVVR
ncbi:uncharacterized protein BDW43DRAFT_312600 [Aspergillus alliaceus]|uniref:uncharacterized protein n=1 Tax=Petromyces alliaceus TaxID=209559 RepID=UPI0012A4E78B|nr:uncharacterized protein BDW43DRAFT_312600 [Aspergillus alliaceus]KAB8231983.1 hypothetical protein BDW43DRAFT_312600 [Aspergillus alliaceus]